MTASPRKNPLVIASFSIVSGMLAASNVLGLLRDLVIGRTFGATGQTDAFFAAFPLVSTFTLFFLAGTVQGALLPRYMARAPVSPERAGALALEALALTTAVAALFAGGLFVFADPLIRVIYGGFDEARVRIAAEAVRWLAPTVLAAAWGAVAQTLLHAERRFLAPAVVPLLSNLFVIGAVLGLGSALGILALSIGYLAGGLLWVVIVLPFAWPYFGRGGSADAEDRRRMLRAFAALSALVMFDSLSGLVQRSILSFFDEGILSAFAYGSRIAGLPIAFIGTGLATVLFPRLVATAAQSRAALADTFRFGFLTTSSILAPTAVLLGLVAHPVIDLLFGGRIFNPEAVRNTATILMIYSAAMPGQALIIFLERSYLAAERSTLVVWTAITAGSAQIAITYALVTPLGWLAVPVGTCIYGYMHAFALFALSGRFIGHDYRALGASLIKILAASALMAPVLLAPLPEGLPILVLRCVVAALLFIGALYAFKERTWLQLFATRS